MFGKKEPAVQMIDAFIFACAPFERFDPVAAADIRDQFDQCVVGCRIHTVRIIRVRRDLDRYGAVIVRVI